LKSSTKARTAAGGAKIRRGPGRPTAARVEQINAVILDAALREFYREGFHKARMENIAAAAKVSKGTLYGRYPTKESLLSTVISQHVAQAAAARDPRAPSSSSDLRQQLKHRARQLSACICAPEFELLERLFIDSPSVAALKQLQYEFGHKQTMNAIAQEIIDGQPQQPIDRDSAVRMAEMLTAMLIGWWRTQKEYGRVRVEEMLPYAEHAVDVLLDGRKAWTARSR
jgi:AcrR family transcriptional regulator